MCYIICQVLSYLVISSSEPASCLFHCDTVYILKMGWWCRQNKGKRKEGNSKEKGTFIQWLSKLIISLNHLITFTLKFIHPIFNTCPQVCFLIFERRGKTEGLGFQKETFETAEKPQTKEKCCYQCLSNSRTLKRLPKMWLLTYRVCSVSQCWEIFQSRNNLPSKEETSRMSLA